MPKPAALRPGDEVRIVTPASPLTPDQTADGIRLLESWGLKVTLAPNIYAADGYLAGPDEARAKDLMDAFLDPNVKAVFCSRGGYGCARLMPHLDLNAIVQSQKLFCGFSDVTTLHLALNQMGFPTLHSPMLITLSVERPDWVIESLRRGLFGEDSLAVDHPAGETLIPGTVEGEIIGGCMILIADSLGTSYAIDTTNKILVLEDVDENPHRVDAKFTQLRNSGLLEKAAGIVIGEMTGTDERRDEKIGSWPWRQIVEDRVKGLKVPTIVNYPFGHMKTMLTLPLGIKARLDAERGTLTLLESLCDAG